MMDEAARTLVSALRERHLTIATAESLTGGAVCAAIASIPGASAVLLGGICAYTATAKAQIVGVDPDLIAHYGTVAPDIAAALATGARTRFGADIGIGTTGVAGPDPLEGHPVGTVYIAAASSTQVKTRALALRGERNQIRAQAALAALELVHGLVQNH